MTLSEISNLKKKIEAKRPLVHCITNIVTVNDCANALLALGASPTMAHHPLEVADVAKAASALVLNMGAMESLDAMLCAGKAAREAGVPIVLDPVGAAGAAFRRESTSRVIDEVCPDVIRGNVSELMALAGEHSRVMGVDAAPAGEINISSLKEYSKATGAIVVASGATDYIISGDEAQAITGGSALMSRITGAGCMATCLMGAFLSLGVDVTSVVACVQLMNECAKRAEDKTYALDGGTMTFRNYFIDEVYKF